MARPSSILDDLITLPWWFNLILAAIVYVSLKFWLPTIEFHSPIFRGFASFIPRTAGISASILIFAAAMSALMAWRKGELLNKQTSISSVKNLPWKDFEYLVGEAYRRKGYSVHENLGSGPDGGVDLTLTKDGETLLVQCKNWRSKPVGVSVVRELLGVVAAEGASGGIVVCSGRFTPDAIEFAHGKPIELVSGSELIRLIGDVQPRPAAQPKVENVSAAPLLSPEPACLTCSRPMVKRTARKTGRQFWGCSQFPKRIPVRGNAVLP